MRKASRNIAYSLMIFTMFSCSTTDKTSSPIPSWYSSPKQNDSDELYGVSDGNTIEEATKFALVNLASKLMVSVSSESNLIKEENQVSINEEIRQKVSEQIEKISFSNFRVSRSENVDTRYYVEVEVDRAKFLLEQQDKISVLDTRIALLQKEASSSDNPVKKSMAFSRAVELSKQHEILSNILSGLGENVNPKNSALRTADLDAKMRSVNNKLEFYFDGKPKTNASILLRNALTKTGARITPGQGRGRIGIKVKDSSETSEIYSSFVTKVKIDFECKMNGKVIASNSVEVSGGSMVSKQESELAAMKTFEKLLGTEGVMKVIGLANEKAQ